MTSTSQDNMKIEVTEKEVVDAVNALKNVKPVHLEETIGYLYCSTCGDVHSTLETKQGCFPEVANLLKHE